MASLASCSYQCVYIRDGQTFTLSLIGNNGDIMQTYAGPASAPQAGSIIPDWSGSDKPFWRVSLMESDPNITAAQLAALISDNNTKWYVDGDEILFGNDGLSLKGTAAGTFKGRAGIFRKLSAAAGSNHLADAPYGGLQVRDNLVADFAGVSATITCVLALTVDSQPVFLQDNAPLRFARRGDGDNLAHIYCDASQSMVLDADHSSVTLKARCWQAGAELASANFSRKWFLLEAGAWVQKSTADTYNVTRDDIPTFGDIKVECWTKDATPKLIASDVQTVADQTDGLIVIPNPTPADGKIRQGDSNTGVTFNPVLTDVDGNTPFGSASLRYLFTVMNSAGMILNPASNAFGMAASTTQFTQNPATKFAVPRAVFENEGEGPLVNITCVKV